MNRDFIIENTEDAITVYDGASAYQGVILNQNPNGYMPNETSTLSF